MKNLCFVHSFNKYLLYSVSQAQVRAVTKTKPQPQRSLCSIEGSENKQTNKLIHVSR